MMPGLLEMIGIIFNFYYINESEIFMFWILDQLLQVKINELKRNIRKCQLKSFDMYMSQHDAITPQQ